VRAAVAIGLGVLLLAPATARADDWLMGVGFGHPTPGGDLDVQFDTQAQIAGRITLGRTFGPWAIDAVFFGADLSAAGRESTHSTLSLGADVTRFVAIGHGVDIYARGGLSYTWLVTCPGHAVPPPGPRGYSGRSLQYGFGARWMARAWTLDRTRTITGGVALDLNHQILQLEAAGKKAMRGTLDMVTVVFVLGGSW
jgi:hypothetical protein